MEKRKVIIYGAGSRGRTLYQFIKSKNKENMIYGFCDRKFSEIKNIEDKTVYSYEEIKHLQMDFLISMTDSWNIKEVEEKLINDGHTVFLPCNLAEFLGEKNNIEFNEESNPPAMLGRIV